MRSILNEEEYFERLGKILKRDFFPSLQEEFSETERLSISEFQSLYTTEDNASFEELLARENERKRAKFERIYGGAPELVDDPNRRLLLKASSVDEWKFKRKPQQKDLLKWNDGIVDERSPRINIKNTRFPGKEDESKNTGKSFVIPPSPAREQLAHSLTASKPKKATGKVSDSVRRSTPRVPSYALDDLKALTPKRRNNK